MLLLDELVSKEIPVGLFVAKLFEIELLFALPRSMPELLLSETVLLLT
jgi:hypothetical protein